MTRASADNQVFILRDDDEIACDLLQLRREWQEATEGSLDRVTLNLELLFHDIFLIVGLDAKLLVASGTNGATMVDD